MKSLTASNAKREFGDLLIKAQHAPVGINKNGKPVAVIVSAIEYEQLQNFKELQLQAALQKGKEDMDNARENVGADVIERLRQLAR